MKRDNTQDVRRAATRALAFLERSRSLIEAGEPAIQLRAVVICALCCDLAERNPRGTRALVRDFCAPVARLPVASLLSCGGPLLLLAFHAAKRFRLPVPSLAAYADAAAQALREAKTLNHELAASATLLWRAGLTTGRPRYPQLRVDVLAMVLGGRKATFAQLDGIEAATAYGTQAVSAPVLAAAALEAVAMGALQEYDIDLACRTLRARSYLGSGNGLALQTARRFLLSNQDFDGSFGFFDREIESLRLKSHVGDARLAVKIPLTLACLWTLGELELHVYRLFRDVGKYS